MASIFLLTLLGARLVSSQIPCPDSSFDYYGCARVDWKCFSGPVPLPGGYITPEVCKQACDGHLFAAVFPDGCRCGDDPNSVSRLDESQCNFPCMGDPTLGMCGAICPGQTSAIGNVYSNTSSPFGTPSGPGSQGPSGPPLPPSPPLPPIIKPPPQPPSAPVLQPSMAPGDVSGASVLPQPSAPGWPSVSNGGFPQSSFPGWPSNPGDLSGLPESFTAGSGWPSGLGGLSGLPDSSPATTATGWPSAPGGSAGLPESYPAPTGQPWQPAPGGPGSPQPPLTPPGWPSGWPYPWPYPWPYGPGVTAGSPQSTFAPNIPGWPSASGLPQTSFAVPGWPSGSGGFPLPDSSYIVPSWPSMPSDASDSPVVTQTSIIAPAGPWSSEEASILPQPNMPGGPSWPQQTNSPFPPGWPGSGGSGLPQSPNVPGWPSGTGGQPNPMPPGWPSGPWGNPGSPLPPYNPASPGWPSAPGQPGSPQFSNSAFPSGWPGSPQFSNTAFPSGWPGSPQFSNSAFPPGWPGSPQFSSPALPNGQPGSQASNTAFPSDWPSGSGGYPGSPPPPYSSEFPGWPSGFGQPSSPQASNMLPPNWPSPSQNGASQSGDSVPPPGWPSGWPWPGQPGSPQASDTALPSGWSIPDSQSGSLPGTQSGLSQASMVSVPPGWPSTGSGSGPQPPYDDSNGSESGPNQPCDPSASAVLPPGWPSGWPWPAQSGSPQPSSTAFPPGWPTMGGQNSGFPQESSQLTAPSPLTVGDGSNLPESQLTATPGWPYGSQVPDPQDQDPQASSSSLNPCPEASAGQTPSHNGIPIPPGQMSQGGFSVPAGTDNNGFPIPTAMTTDANGLPIPLTGQQPGASGFPVPGPDGQGSQNGFPTDGGGSGDVVPSMSSVTSTIRAWTTVTLSELNVGEPASTSGNGSPGEPTPVWTSGSQPISEGQAISSAAGWPQSQTFVSDGSPSWNPAPMSGNPGQSYSGVAPNFSQTSGANAATGWPQPSMSQAGQNPPAATCECDDATQSQLGNNPSGWTSIPGVPFSEMPPTPTLVGNSPPFTGRPWPSVPGWSPQIPASQGVPNIPYPGASALPPSSPGDEVPGWPSMPGSQPSQYPPGTGSNPTGQAPGAPPSYSSLPDIGSPEHRASIQPGSGDPDEPQPGTNTTLPNGIPGFTNKPEAESPIPSRVTGSGSSNLLIPSLAAMFGFALAALTVI